MSKGKKPTELSAKDLDYQTPERILALARAYFDGEIPLDPATSWSNPARAKFICTGPHTKDSHGAPGVDGLAVSWRLPGFQKQGVWTNPPWGHLFKPFLAKILSEALASPEIPMLVLLPVSRTEQQYLTDVFQVVNALCFIRKRVPFVRPDTGLPAKGNPYNSWLLGLNVDVARFFEHFSVLGRCLSVSPVGSGRRRDRPFD